METQGAFVLCVNEPGFLPDMQDEVVTFDNKGDAKRAWWAEYRSYVDEGYEIVQLAGGSYALLVDPETGREVAITIDWVEVVA